MFGGKILRKTSHLSGRCAACFKGTRKEVCFTRILLLLLQYLCKCSMKVYFMRVCEFEVISRRGRVNLLKLSFSKLWAHSMFQD